MELTHAYIREQSARAYGIFVQSGPWSSSPEEFSSSSVSCGTSGLGAAVGISSVSSILCSLSAARSEENSSVSEVQREAKERVRPKWARVLCKSRG